MIRLAAALVLATPSVAQAACGDLRQAIPGHVTVIEATEVPAGRFAPPPQFGPPPLAIDLPAHCRLRGVASPVRGSRIGFELWLPLGAAWNGRLQMFGNGGYSGSIPVQRLAEAMRAGYAATATDTGHQGDDPEFAVGRPESIDDWGHRAVHETVVAAKALAARLYGRAPRYSYFDGCSTGGHQGLMEAQRYPADFDGIVAGAPGSNRTRLNVGFLWQYVANHRPDGSLILPAAKLKLLTAGALRICGSAAEQAQGFLEDPFTCRFDPTVLQCLGASADTCLDADQVAAARLMYQGARNPRTGAQIYPPWLAGSESHGHGWSLYWADPVRPSEPARASFFRFWAFGDPGWEARSFDFDRDLARLAPLARRIDAVNPDLEPFRRRGGKLIQYHGLADPVVSPWDSRNYHARVAALQGTRTDSFYRLFFLPGVAHCVGGPGFAGVRTQDSIEAWVERGQAPAVLALTGGKAERSVAPARPHSRMGTGLPR